MQMYAFKVLGTVHGLFGLFILFYLGIAVSQGLFNGMESARVLLKTSGTVTGGVLLILCMWSTWRHPEWSAMFAWSALAAFVLSATGDEVFENGVSGLFGLMPTFYIMVGVRSLAALALGILAGGAETTSIDA